MATTDSNGNNKENDNMATINHNVPISNGHVEESKEANGHIDTLKPNSSSSKPKMNSKDDIVQYLCSIYVSWNLWIESDFKELRIFAHSANMRYILTSR